MSILNPKEPNGFSNLGDEGTNNGYWITMFDEFNGLTYCQEIEDDKEIENDDLENFEA